MIRIRENALVPNTMALPSRAAYLVKIKTKADVVAALSLAKDKNLPFVPIGHGSNILPKEYIKAVVGIMKIKGIKRKDNIFEVGAGETWDDFVKKSVQKGYCGAEDLSLIPGTVGACPVQNIGAYGTEAKDIIKSVGVYDCRKRKFVALKNKECKFGYRTSVFKQKPGRFVITSVIFKLKSKIKNIKQKRKAIIKMRKTKLPDYKKIPNAGSFFINPILKGQKVYAGKLIEEAGLKGAGIGRMVVWHQNALILTNPQKACFGEIMKAENLIRKKILRKFNINLQREPVVIG